MLVWLISNKIIWYAESMGMSKTVAQSVVTFAVPLIMSKLANNVSEKDGLGSLVEALGQHGSEVDQEADQIDSQDGLNILKHIFWWGQNKLTETIAKWSGAQHDQVTDLLWKIAPLIMGQLSKQKQDHWLDQSGIQELLGQAQKEVEQESEWATSKLLWWLLDKDGDGDFNSSDALKHGMGLLQWWLGKK